MDIGTSRHLHSTIANWQSIHPKRVIEGEKNNKIDQHILIQSRYKTYSHPVNYVFSLETHVYL